MSESVSGGYASGSALGQSTDYGQDYDPGLLQPISREAYRAQLEQPLPAGSYSGIDRWHCYEASWLNASGVPQVALGELTIPADSLCIVESKSLKLYLNSLNRCAFDEPQAYIERVRADLASRTGSEQLQFSLLAQRPAAQPQLGWLCLDDLDVHCSEYQRNAGLLRPVDGEVDDALLYSDLLRSNCPVTGQPDWGSVIIRYSGQQLDPGSVLQYIVSLREHNGFHEHCVEQIFTDLWQAAGLRELLVQANYTRRGGIDICPARYTPGLEPVPGLSWRQ